MTKSFIDLPGWSKRDFQIMVGQALNLAVETMAAQQKMLGESVSLGKIAPMDREGFMEIEVKALSKFFFKILLELRDSDELQKLYVSKEDGEKGEDITMTPL